MSGSSRFTHSLLFVFYRFPINIPARCLLLIMIGLLWFPVVSISAPLSINTAGLIPPSDAPIPNQSDHLGHAVAIDNDIAAVSAHSRIYYTGTAPWTDSRAPGTVYLFQKNSGTGVWEWSQSLSETESLLFGHYVDLSGNLLVVGTSTDDNDMAFVYTYERVNDVWVKQHKLSIRTDGISLSEVKISGNTLAVAMTTRQEIYTWQDNAWVLQQTIGNNGSALALENDTLVVGEDGSITVYKRSGGSWAEIDSATSSSSSFGRAVALSGNRILVGDSSLGHPGISNLGKVWVYQFDGTSLSWDGTIDVPAEDRVDDAYFGSSVAINGDTAVINGDLPYAYVFVWDGIWTLQQRLLEAGHSMTWAAIAIQGDQIVVGTSDTDTAAGTNAGGIFFRQRNSGIWESVDYDSPGNKPPQGGVRYGSSIDLAGNWAVVGAPDQWIEDIQEVGVAYLFNRQKVGWVPAGMLPPIPPTDAREFGTSVAIREDGVLLVGAPATTVDELTGAGKVYLYRWNGSSWDEFDSLIAPTPVSGGRFGEALFLEGNRLLVGAPKNARGHGNVYSYSEDISGNWGLHQTLSSGVAGHYGFGSALALSEGWLLAAANDISGDPVAVYAFELVPSGSFDPVWQLRGQLPNPDGLSPTGFGTAIALSGTKALIGHPDQDLAHLYQHDGIDWVLDYSWSGPDTVPGDRFGSSVAIEGSKILIGAKMHDSDGVQDAGAIYVYQQIGNGVGDSVHGYSPIMGGTKYSSGEFEDQLGAALAMENGEFIVGAPAATYPKGMGKAFVGKTTGTACYADEFIFNDLSFDQDDPVVCEGRYYIQALGYVRVMDNADVTFTTPQTFLQSGFTVSNGATFQTITEAP